MKKNVRVTQSMVKAPDETPKGIKIVLQERGLWSASLRLDTAKDLLGSQPDFTSQKCHFHCEFNFIKMYWGALKNYCREHCDYSFAKLLSTIKAAMKHVKLASIRRYARKCWRYMDAYRKGLSLEKA
ncbi:hypothetical protein SPRG_12403 [Saprolegnia parasitica CBS 223.65]|uniref:Uncharacterized protein n=1 Tax=Saprolegnia parasitica (strain CBS 223.65) TaxID=695850 RepID=A0A067C3K5_SAPPC|nr:hypothetical protein SPRG_12403 [Saprolegnia parasitica CBS 223.65]KDO21397.1 hypothetical protein SPRG_12403 [Saprolegnia parasitica CBS 223.65]|eukprot:XP_012207845.1 hypothetical protein SPRG_12403 [Saprolegnia parasitica CBS 223.65]